MDLAAWKSQVSYENAQKSASGQSSCCEYNTNDFNGMVFTVFAYMLKKFVEHRYMTRFG